MTTSELTAPPEEAAASRSKTSGAGLLKWFWPEILGSVKGQLAETLDSGQSFGCRPMTLSGLKSVDQQIRPPLAAPVAAIPARRCPRFLPAHRIQGSLNRRS
jgi:hypothetical protein